jgi:chemotaxis protein MotB
MFRTALASAALLALTTACVTTKTHEKAVADLTAQHNQALDKVKAQDDADKARIAELDKKLAETEAARKDLEEKLSGLQKKTDELGKLLEGTSGEKEKLDKLLKATSHELEVLNQQKAAAEARAAVYKSLTDRLRSMIDGGKLSVKIRKGRMLISLPNDVLFESGSAQLKKAGQAAIAQVAQALSSLSDRQFLVAGHTDDRPINSKTITNWELSTARAVDVTRFLIAKGMKPTSLGAVGYGEFDPIVPNDSDEHRAQNRRIEIALQPNLSELPAMEEPK